MSIDSWKVLKRFVESIYLNTTTRIEVFSSYDASMEPSRSTLHIYLGIHEINVLYLAFGKSLFDIFSSSNRLSLLNLGQIRK